MRRRFLGRYNDIVTRHAVYATADAIEVDEREVFSMLRKRVFFEDVLLVTLHERVGILPIFLSLGFGTLLGLIGLASGGAGGGVTALFALPFLLNGIIRIRIKESIITIFGRRSRARIRFTLRREHARRLYDELCAQIRGVQSAMNPPAEEERSSERREEEPWLTSSNLVPPQ